MKTYFDDGTLKIRSVVPEDAKILYDTCFFTDILEGEMAHARFYNEEIRKWIPKCHYKRKNIVVYIIRLPEQGRIVGTIKTTADLLTIPKGMQIGSCFLLSE